MKKNKEIQKDCCFKASFDSFKKQVKVKFQEAQKCAKKNPQKTKTILAGVGTFFIAVVAFLIGKNKNKDQNQD